MQHAKRLASLDALSLGLAALLSSFDVRTQPNAHGAECTRCCTRTCRRPTSPPPRASRAALQRTHLPLS